MTHDDPREPAGDELELHPFIASARQHLDEAAAQRRAEGPPPPPPLPPRSGRVGLLVAAAIVLVASVAAVLATRDLLTPSTAFPAQEAQHVVTPGEASTATPGRAEPRAPQPIVSQTPTPAADEAVASPPRGPDEPAPEPEPAAPRPAGGTDHDEGKAVAEPEPPTSTSPQAPPSSGRAASKEEPSRPSLAELDAQAQLRWRAGDLDGAEALFLEIVKRGGRTRYAELAFGDLFTLAHQAGNTTLEQRRWSRYLARFPRGHFADDVRAGQCRRAAGHDQAPCWRRYLRDWPAGAHRAEAQRALPEDAP